jgi:hypothetical protein
MSNFDFLKRNWTEISSSAQKAERYIYSDPRSSCFYARRALEQTINWLYDHDAKLERPFEDSLNDLMSTPAFRAHIPPQINDKAHDVRKLGNQAVHEDHQIRSQDSYNAVRELHTLLCWLARTYPMGNPQSVPSQFDTNRIPKTETQSQTQSAADLRDLEKRLQALDAKLQQQAQANDRPSKTALQKQGPILRIRQRLSGWWRAFWLGSRKGALRPWWNLFFSLLFCWLAIYLIGFFQFVVTHTDFLPSYWIALSGLALLIALVLFLRAFWRFLRGLGFRRLISTVSVLLVLAVVAFAFSRPTEGDSAGRFSAALYDLITTVRETLRERTDQTFLSGQEGAQRYLLPEGDLSGEEQLPAEDPPLTAAPTRKPGQPASASGGAVPTEIEIGIQVQVNTNGKNLHGRGEPGLSGSLETRFENGSLLKVVNGPVEKDGYIWWQVEGEAGVGWSASEFLVPYGP